MTVRANSDQLEYRGALDQITSQSATAVGLNSLLESLNSALTPPLSMRASATPNLTVNIGGINVANPQNNRSFSIPPINGVSPTVSSLTITVNSGGTLADVSVGSDLSLTIGANQYLKIGVHLTSAGGLVLSQGTANAVLANATHPPLVDNNYPIGWFYIQTITGTVQPIADTNISVYVPGRTLDFATGSLSGVVSTGTQTFAGDKTFSGKINNLTITAPGTPATLTLGAGSSLITSGGHSLTFATTGVTSLTLPTSGTIVTSGNTVASFSGGTTGLTPNSPTTGAIVLAGTLAIGNGGTGATTANAALNALLPTQGIGNTGKGLITDGTNASWSAVVTNPMTSIGDMIHGGASGVPTRLSAGTANYVLQANGASAPTWNLLVDANISGSAAIAGSKIVAATEAVAGVVTTGTQTFAGIKTWVGAQNFQISGALDAGGYDNAGYWSFGRTGSFTLTTPAVKIGTSALISDNFPLLALNTNASSNTFLSFVSNNVTLGKIGVTNNGSNPLLTDGGGATVGVGDLCIVGKINQKMHFGLGGQSLLAITSNSGDIIVPFGNISAEGGRIRGRSTSANPSYMIRYVDVTLTVTATNFSTPQIVIITTGVHFNTVVGVTAADGGVNDQFTVHSYTVGSQGGGYVGNLNTNQLALSVSHSNSSDNGGAGNMRARVWYID